MGELRSFRAVYPANRAAALAGIPKSTIYYWAREGIYTPSVSQVKEKLWSLSDLLAMRAIYWLRQDKPDAARTTMNRVRAALKDAAKQQIPFGTLDLFVDPKGTIFYKPPAGSDLRAVGGQTVMTEAIDSLNLLREFLREQAVGPDLRRPREHLRIVPGKLGGEPHLEGTRIATATIAALSERGFSEGRIIELYPHLRDHRSAIRNAIDLERQLAANLREVA